LCDRARHDLCIGKTLRASRRIDRAGRWLITSHVIDYAQQSLRARDRYRHVSRSARPLRFRGLTTMRATVAPRQEPRRRLSGLARLLASCLTDRHAPCIVTGRASPRVTGKRARPAPGQGSRPFSPSFLRRAAPGLCLPPGSPLRTLARSCWLAWLIPSPTAHLTGTARFIVLADADSTRPSVSRSASSRSLLSPSPLSQHLDAADH